VNWLLLGHCDLVIGYLSLRGEGCYTESVMDKNSAAPSSTLSAGDGSLKGTKTDEKNEGEYFNARSAFVHLALTMSWQLAVCILLPVFLGVQLDKPLHSGNLWLFVGLGIAIVGSAAVMWHAMQIANKLPVPKLTDAERRAIKKSYEDEDKER
jgi:hypothetical protein